LQNVKGLRGLEIGAPLTGYSVEAIAALTQLEELGLPQEPVIYTQLPGRWEDFHRVARYLRNGWRQN
jgi:hypothetical protein